MLSERANKIPERTRIGIEATNEIFVLSQVLLEYDKSDFYELASRGITIRIAELTRIVLASVSEDSTEPTADLLLKLFGTNKGVSNVV